MSTHIFRTVALALVFAAGVAFGQWTDEPVVAAQANAKVFELRTYTAPPGKLAALHTRFRDHTVRLFEKHGMVNVGYWAPQDAPLAENTLIYILEHRSRAAAEASWKAFHADPEWQKARDASEVNGRIVEKVDRVWMTATDYSAIK